MISFWMQRRIHKSVTHHLVILIRSSPTCRGPDTKFRFPEKLQKTRSKKNESKEKENEVLPENWHSMTYCCNEDGCNSATKSASHFLVLAVSGALIAAFNNAVH
ncbi:unnamed protein product [Phyllotreta striolata]|uniref:Uncharacterized protein n=1 Tax=Phyllotreta striolata TaxID=444603 RepID=A0A9N9TSG9_PHYSR|nr:unnamed protein product [Phyllotreta striolata]